MKKQLITIAGIVLFIIILIVFNFILNSENKQDIGKNDNQVNNEEEKKVEILKCTSSNFEDEVLKSEKTVLIDFYADWCGPCRMLAPTVKEIASEIEDVKVVKVNIDKEEDLAIKYDIMSIPTLVAIKEGEEINRLVGLVDKAEILEMLK